MQAPRQKHSRFAESHGALADILLDMHNDQTTRMNLLNTEVNKLKRALNPTAVPGHAVTIRDAGSGMLGAPAIYRPTTTVWLGTALSANSFKWASAPFQINLELNDISAGNQVSPATAGTIPYWNGNRASGDMTAGNWIDGDQYVLTLDVGATSMAVCSHGSGCVMEPGIQWTITGWGQTVLRGTFEPATPAYDANRLVVKESAIGLPEYRPFDPSLHVNVQENMDFAHTELKAYEYQGLLSEGAELKAVLLDSRFVQSETVVGAFHAELEAGNIGE